MTPFHSLFPFNPIVEPLPKVMGTKRSLKFSQRQDTQLKELTKIFHRGSGLSVTVDLPKPGGASPLSGRKKRVVFLKSSTTLKQAGYLQINGIELELHRYSGWLPLLTHTYVGVMYAVFHDSPEKVFLGTVLGRTPATVLVRAAQSEVGIRVCNGTLIGTPDGKALLSNK